MTKLKIHHKFTILQFLLWLSWGTFGLFYIAYLESLNYSSKTIALGLILSTIFGTIAQYLWGYIGDLTSKIKSLFLIVLTLLTLSVVAFGFFVDQPSLMILFMTLIGMGWLPLEALLDSWILSTKGIKPSNYSRIRSGGSLGFAVTTLFFGRFVLNYGYNLIIWGFVMAASLLFILALSTHAESSKKPTPLHLKDLIALLKNPSYVQILIFSMLIFFNHMSINNFYIYIFEHVGGNASHIGYAASAAAFTEIIGFYSIKYIERWLKPMIMFIIVALLSFFRVFLLTASLSYIGVILTAIIQGAMFSLFMATFKVYIAKITPLSLLASAQTIGASTYFGLASIFASFIGGMLIDDFGVTSFYRFMNVIAFVTVLYSILIYFLAKRRVK